MTVFPYTEKPSSENSTVSYTVRGIIKGVIAVELNANSQMEASSKAILIENQLKGLTKYNPFVYLGFISEVDYYENN